MPLFEVVILETPKKEDNLERIVIPPVAVVASDEQNAAISVVLDNADMKIKKDRMQVIVRPFS